MRTANYRDSVIYAIAFRLGLDPRRDLRSDQLLEWATFINLWVAKLWDRVDWPEWTLIEERTPTAGHLVLSEELNATALGKVLRVYVRDPRVARGPVDVPFRRTDTGIHVGFNHGPTVWVKFMERPPRFSGAVFSGTKVYEIDDRVYDPITGETYRRRLVAGGTPLLSNEDRWRVISFPEVLVEPVVRGAYADALRDDGQTDKAQAEEQAAIAAVAERANAQLGGRADILTDQQQPRSLVAA